MSKNESNDISYFKELGSLQEKVLFYLAENPKTNTQEIQKGIRYPSEQYGNVNKAVKALEKLKFAKSKEGKSQKGVDIKLYSCTENGIFYTLARNPKSDIKKIVGDYKQDYQFFTPFLDLYSVWGKERITKFFENSFEFVLIMKKEGQEKALSFLLMKILDEAQDLDQKTRKRIAREILKRFPKTRQIMRKMKKTLDEILGE